MLPTYTSRSASFLGNLPGALSYSLRSAWYCSAGVAGLSWPRAAAAAASGSIRVRIRRMGLSPRGASAAWTGQSLTIRLAAGVGAALILSPRERLPLAGIRFVTSFEGEAGQRLREALRPEAETPAA